MKDTELYAVLLDIRRPWHVRDVQINPEKGRVDVWIEEDAGATFACAVCGKSVGVYDHTEEQVWRHLDTCQYQTYVHARLPRTACPDDGVKQIATLWAEPRSQWTRPMEIRLIDVMKECDLTGVTRLMQTSWDQMLGVQCRAVQRGLSRKERRVPERIGIDEKSLGKGHHYESIVCDLDRGVVEYVVDDRKQESLETYYRLFTSEELAGIKAVALDMWDPYIAATRACVPDADKKIVFDRYHVTTQMTKAVDKVRRMEQRTLEQEGDRRLVKTKYLWLRNEENIPPWRRGEFDKIKNAELKTSRAWAIKEALRGFWGYVYPQCAGKYFKAWHFWATHSRLRPVISAARTLKRHLAGIMTYFTHRVTNATAEGINSKIQTIKQMACGYRNREHYRMAIYFHCGGLDLYPRPCTEAGAA